MGKKKDNKRKANHPSKCIIQSEKREIGLVNKMHRFIFKGINDITRENRKRW